MRLPLDIQLLNGWFKRGYGSKEMANFYLLADIAQTPSFFHSSPDRVENAFNYYHDEIVKQVYQK